MDDGVVYVVQVHGDWDDIGAWRKASWRPAFGLLESSIFDEPIANAKKNELEAKAKRLGLANTSFRIMCIAVGGEE